MRNTQRNLTNIPVNLEGLVHLEDIDMSQNELTKIPEGLLTIPNLKRLNLGSNQVSKPESLFSWSLTIV
jgi:Leucine-rich repeat (LRR) protein